MNTVDKSRIGSYVGVIKTWETFEKFYSLAQPRKTIRDWQFQYSGQKTAGSKTHFLV